MGPKLPHRCCSAGDSLNVGTCSVGRPRRPCTAIATSADGDSFLSGSFDTAAIRWSLKAESAEQVLRFHSDAVNAVAFLKDRRMVTAGADAKIAIWTRGRQQPDLVFEGHGAPIVSLAVSPDGARLASASWDHTVRVWSLSPTAHSKCWKGTHRTSTASHSRRMVDRWSAWVTIVAS